VVQLAAPDKLLCGHSSPQAKTHQRNDATQSTFRVELTRARMYSG
jgi:hypothetical protein